MPFGNFIIEKPETEEVKQKTSFTGHDYMIKFNIPYKDRVTYPIALGDYFEDLCSQVGLEVGNINFVNSDYIVLGNPFTNNEDCKTVLSNIAQLAGGFAYIGRDNKVYIKTLQNTSKLLKVKDVHEMTVRELDMTLVKMLTSSKKNADERLDGNNYLEDFSKNNIWGEVNSLILRISGTEGENTVIEDEASIEKNGLTEVVIEDNYFLISQEEREKVITPLWNALKGIKYLPFKTEYYGYPYLDVGDMLYILDVEDKGYISYVFNYNFTFNGGYSGNLETKALTKTQTAYKNTSNGKTKFRQVERKIDKINGTIEDVIEEQTDFSNKITKTIQDVDSITDEIHRMYNFEKEVQGTNEIILQDCLSTTILELRVKPAKINTEILYPKTDLYPSLTTYPHKAGDGATIVFAGRSRVLEGDTIYPSQDRYPSQDLIPIGDSSTKKFQLYFGEPLRSFNNVSDELQILFNEESGICEAKVIRRIDYNNEVYTIYNIPKEEQISELTMELFKGNNYVYLEEYTDWNIYARYIFNNELNKEYTPRIETNSKIRRTADEINLEVGKKVGKNEIITSINLSPEEAKIKSKALELEGYTTINGGFEIDEEGNASIANDTVQINKNGIQMADGASLVGGKGLLSNLQFMGKASTLSTGIERGNYGVLGFLTDFTTAFRNEIEIDVDVPENFTIESAYITLRHYPLKVMYDGQTKGWGYARKLRLYYTNSESRYLEYNIGGSAFDTESSGSEITGAFGSNGFTPSTPNNNNHKIETIISGNIKGNLTGGKTTLYIKSSEAIPSSSDYETLNTQCALKSGMVSAILNIFGYLKLEAN